LYLANPTNTPDFRAVADYTQSVHDHRTGRKCTRCGGTLHDTIINFSEPLPERELTLAFEHASKADLCLVLGSSLTVNPANEIPEVVGKRRRRGAKLVICNLQATPLDGMAELRVYAKTDELMVRVMRELELEISGFVLERRLALTVERPGQRLRVRVEGVDVDGTPVSFLRSVRLANNRRVVKAEPFVFDLKGDFGDGGLALMLELEFMGHYGEPNLELVHLGQREELGNPVLYLLHYNPYNGEWKTSRV
jgi:mono-ADP-ribosyltransferase sirtuin 6